MASAIRAPLRFIRDTWIAASSGWRQPALAGLALVRRPPPIAAVVAAGDQHAQRQHGQDPADHRGDGPRSGNFGTRARLHGHPSTPSLLPALYLAGDGFASP